ncbi:hypothetical protein PRZ48_004792 [Zasmidium cellare]|uniref:Major facilitator superfamily (MFS) profile domain-containing protein n=1 Tax=Zasmidium cellare TaxID=395010 RepID=A0ABR0EQR6_ZASCE|nr:hypothetical protein PRZ48_004792 [Zasmidium cellare]
MSDNEDRRKLDANGDEEKGEVSSDEPERDENIVTWDGPDDQANPKNWSFKRRWLATALVSLITFMTPIASSMIAPAQQQIGDDLGVHSTFGLSLIFSIFLLAFVFGPLFIAPSSEIWGRVIVLQLANIWFLIWNLACGFAYNNGSMLAFRFLSGLGGCAPQTVGGGVLSDLWRADERGMAVSIYTLAPILGPALGPLMGAWIAERTTWRWCFWAVTIFGVCVQVLIYFTLSETYGPRLLYWKAKKLRKETGNQNLRTEYELAERTRLRIFQHAFYRPLRLITTQPIIQFLAIYQSLIFGIIYLMLSTFPTVWTDIYHESTGIGGLNYISIMVGFTAGAQSGGYMVAYIYRRLCKTRPDGKGIPEFRVPIVFVGTGLVAGGLFMYGWSAQAHTHWIVPNIGAAIFSIGAMFVMTCLQTYLIDAYGVFSASAIGCMAMARSMTGFGFPLFAPAMFSALGEGWGNSVLAFATLAIGYPGALVLWFYGSKLRARSPFAAGKES